MVGETLHLHVLTHTQENSEQGTISGRTMYTGPPGSRDIVSQLDLPGKISWIKFNK